MNSIIKKFESELIKRNYSDHTIKCYTYALKHFYDTSRVPFSNATHITVKNYFKKRSLSNSSKNVFISAMNCYMLIFGKGTSRYKRFSLDEKPVRMPFFTLDEMQEFLFKLSGRSTLPIELLYGCGLRITECLNLRVRDININSRTITIKRRVPIPKYLLRKLKNQLIETRKIHNKDIKNGNGIVTLPFSIGSEFNISKKYDWQYLFPDSKLSLDRRTKRYIRSHINTSTVQKAIVNASKRKHSAKTIRHSYGVHMLYSSVSVSKLAAIMGYKDPGKIYELKKYAIEKINNKYNNPLDYLEYSHR